MVLEEANSRTGSGLGGVVWPASVIALATLLSCSGSDQLRLADVERSKQALASFDQAALLFRSGRYDDACRAYQQIRAALPDRSRSAAMAQLIGLRDARAYEELLASIEGNLGLAHLRARRFEQAERHLAEAVRIAPRRAKTRANHGIALLRASRPAEAQAALSRAIALGDRRAATYLDLGRAAQQAGDPTAARVALHQALMRARGRSIDGGGTALEAEKSLAELDLEESNHAAAEERLRRVLSRAPGEVQARYLLARAIAKSGRREEAELERSRFEEDSKRLAGIQSVLVEQPGNVEALHWVADTYALLGLHHFAATHYRQLLARDPQDRVAREALIQLSRRTGDTSEN